MGQARNRGTFEERKAQAIARNRFSISSAPVKAAKVSGKSRKGFLVTALMGLVGILGLAPLVGRHGQ